MATLIINLSEHLKSTFQKLCADHGESMTKVIISWINRGIIDESFLKTSDMASKCECLACGTTWTPKKENPLACPDCKSRKWNDAAHAQAKVARMQKKKQSAAESSVKEQKRLFKEFWSEYKRIGKLTEFQSHLEIAAKIGVDPEKLRPYLNGEKPVNPEQVARMKEVL